MKAFALAFLCLFSITTRNVRAALTSLPTFTGFYHAQNDAHIVMKKRIEMVNTLTAEGKNRLQNLRDLDYTCLLISSQIFECSLFSNSPSEADERAINRHNEIYGTSFIHFEERAVTPILTNDAESIKEYTYDQNIQFIGSHFSNFRLLDLGSILKISLGEPTVHSFIVKNDILLINSNYNIQLKRNVRELVIVESSFSK